MLRSMRPINDNNKLVTYFLTAKPSETFCQTKPNPT